MQGVGRGTSEAWLATLRGKGAELAYNTCCTRRGTGIQVGSPPSMTCGARCGGLITELSRRALSTIGGLSLHQCIRH